MRIFEPRCESHDAAALPSVKPDCSELLVQTFSRPACQHFQVAHLSAPHFRAVKPFLAEFPLFFFAELHYGELLRNIQFHPFCRHEKIPEWDPNHGALFGSRSSTLQGPA
jgi:hypothetical protein